MHNLDTWSSVLRLERELALRRAERRIRYEAQLERRPGLLAWLQAALLHLVRRRRLPARLVHRERRALCLPPGTSVRPLCPACGGATRRESAFRPGGRASRCTRRRLPSGRQPA